MKLSWLYCPSVERMCTWIGDTKHVVVTGLEGVDIGNAPLSFELPPGARVFDVERRKADEVAARLGGVEFVVFTSQPSEPLPATTDDDPLKKAP